MSTVQARNPPRWQNAPPRSPADTPVCASPQVGLCSGVINRDLTTGEAWQIANRPEKTRGFKVWCVCDWGRLIPQLEAHDGLSWVIRGIDRWKAEAAYFLSERSVKGPSRAAQLRKCILWMLGVPEMEWWDSRSTLRQNRNICPRSKREMKRLWKDPDFWFLWKI